MQLSLALWLPIALTALASSPVLAKWSQLSSLQLGLNRLLLVSLILLLINSAHQRSLQKTFAGYRKPYAVITGVLFFLHLWTFMEAAHHTSIQHLTIIFSTGPLWTSVFAWLLFREPLARGLPIAVPLVGVGMTLLLGQQHHPSSPTSDYGDAMALITAILHSAYLNAAKGSRRNVPAISLALVQNSVAAFCFAVAFWSLTDLQMIPTSEKGLIAIVLVALFPSLLGHLVMTTLVHTHSLSMLAFAKLAEPSLSVLLAYLMLGEVVTLTSVLAFALTSSGVAYLIYRNTC